MWPKNLHLWQVSGSAGEFFFLVGCILRTTLRNLGISQATGFLMPSFILNFFPVVNIELFLKNDHFKEFGA